MVPILQSINMGELTQARLHKIELEENIRRKDFAKYRISKNMVALTDVVGERLMDEGVITAPCGNKSRGRPQKTFSTRGIAQEIDVSADTLEHAKSHVAAVEAYP